MPLIFVGPWEPCGSGHQEFLHSLRVYDGVGLWGLSGCQAMIFNSTQLQVELTS